MNNVTTPPNTYLPDRVSPPGDTLEDVLEERGMSQAVLAERACLSKKTVNLIIKGKVPLTQESALLFEKALGIPAGFWINREKDYREYLARAEAQRRQSAFAGWAKTFPYAAMAKIGWLAPATSMPEKIDRLLAYFYLVKSRGCFSPGFCIFRRSISHCLAACRFLICSCNSCSFRFRLGR